MLASMSGDYLDFYDSVEQYDAEVDAHDLRNQWPELAPVSATDLPGLFVWAGTRSENHFVAFRDLAESDIADLLIHVLEEVRRNTRSQRKRRGRSAGRGLYVLGRQVCEPS